MDFKITHVAKAFPLIGGGQRQAVNTAEGGTCATITTRYEAIGYGNIITLAHYPMTVVLYEFD